MCEDLLQFLYLGSLYVCQEGLFKNLCSSGQMGVIYEESFKMLNTYFVYYRWV